MEGYGSLTFNRADSKTVIGGIWKGDEINEGEIAYYKIRNGKEE